MSIRIGIYGYGNLGRGVENALQNNPDMELAGIFTRRDPSSIKTQSGTERVFHIDKAIEMNGDIDVMILCGGSATDLPVQTPKMAEAFCVVDSFDTHANIPEHYKTVDLAARNNTNLAVISVGWDPGLFSLNRLYSSAVLPDGNTYTFWGRGVSQGHSDAIRRIKGVLDARQYTVPIEQALQSVRSGTNPVLSTKDKHIRECYVVTEPDCNKKNIENEIVSMPNYFADYQTIVHFISQEELNRDHAEIPHGGFVFRSGKSGIDQKHKQLIEYSLKLDSNPEFTAGVMVAYTRAVFKLHSEGAIGCLTPFDIAPRYLSPLSREDQIKELL